MVKKSSELYIKCPDGEYAELPIVKVDDNIEIKELSTFVYEMPAE